MANKFTISEKKAKLIRSAIPTNTVFGRLDTRFRYEYIHLYVYDMDDNLLTDIVKPPNTFSVSDERIIDFNIGKELRGLGYKEGEFKVIYYFLNEVAGSPEGGRYPYYYLKPDNTPQWGTIQKETREGKEYCYVLNSDGTEELQLEKVANKYSLLEFSKDRTEVSIDIQNIQHWSYHSGLYSITRRKIYPRWQYSNSQGHYVESNATEKYPSPHLQIDSEDPYILTLIPKYDDEQGFDPDIVGATIEIEDVYTFSMPQTLDPITQMFIDNPAIAPPGFDPDDYPYVRQFKHGYRGRITEVLDYNKVRLQKSFQDYESDIRILINDAIVNNNGVYQYFTPQGSSAEGRPNDFSEFTFFNNITSATQIEQVEDLGRILVPQAGTNDDGIKRMFGNSFQVMIPNVDLNKLNLYMVVNNEYYQILNMSEGYGVDGLITKTERIAGNSAPPFWASNVGSINPGACRRFFKLARPLSTNISQFDLVYFVEENVQAHEDKIKLIPFVSDEVDLQFLRIPDTNSKEQPIRNRKTNFKNFTELNGGNTDLKDRIATKLFSGSLLDTELNIPYGRRDVENRDFNDYGFKQVVQYGSAEKRIKNFWDKISAIENYESQSVVWNSVSSSAENQGKYRKLKNGVLNSFDHFENYIYESSGSYVTSSVGEFYDLSFPKKPTKVSNRYVPMSISSSKATTWYNNWTSYGQGFDTINQERIIKNLPAHITEDSTNKVFMDFMDMIGQQLDEVWVYSRHFTDINERASMLTEGISKDITEDVAKSLGLNLVNGNDLLELPEYLFGTDTTGSAIYTESQENITKEIYKRILGSLPYLSETKGTIRAMKGLINCYGIPSSILRVREYGGPNLPGQRTSYEIKRKFNYALDFRSGQYVNHTWKRDPVANKYPDSVEFRFRTPYSVGNSGSMAIVQANEQWAVHTKDNGLTDSYGYLCFGISGSDGSASKTQLGPLPFYNDDMWSVLLTRASSSGERLSNDGQSEKVKYELTAKQYDSTREVILYESSSFVVVDGTGGSGTSGYKQNAYWVSSTGLRLGGWANNNFGARFSGSLMEYRLWTEVLGSKAFNNHVRAPKAYNGNSVTSSYESLVFKLPLNDNVTLTNSDTLDDKSAKSLYENSASTNGFGGGNFFRSIVDLEQLEIPNIGPQRRNATKIRVENQQLGDRLLTPDTRVAASQFDTAPLDSNKVGIYFSPVDVINEDIIYSIADFDFDDVVGDPRDQFELDFRGLEKTQRDYWQKYNKANNFFDYLRILKYYDSGIFDQIRTFIPARANATLGVLVEPNLLERDKEVIGHIPVFESLYYENASDFEEGVEISNNKPDSDAKAFRLGGEFYKIEGTVDGTGYGELGANGSLAINTLNSLDEINGKSTFGSTYVTASITFGGTAEIFTEATQPTIDSARLSEHSQIRQKFYNTPEDAANDNPYSSSFHPSEFESMAKDSSLFRVYYKPVTLTKDNTIDGKEPVEIILTSPTVLISQEPGESPLIVE